MTGGKYVAGLWLYKDRVLMLTPIYQEVYWYPRKMKGDFTTWSFEKLNPILSLSFPVREPIPWRGEIELCSPKVLSSIHWNREDLFSGILAPHWILY
jgi:hypothetical protein